jgi:ATP-dependent DNA helicase DinG
VTSDAATAAADALARVVAGLPGGGEVRDGQRTMATQVADAIAEGRHLVVQAGTGTGKSLAYLVPAILSGRKIVVATATKALQDQLHAKDLPFLAERIGRDVSHAVLKGRSNYLCLQRVREVQRTADGQLDLDDVSPSVRAEVRKLAVWAGSTATGDQAELTWSPAPRAWQSVSVSAEECPGAARCPLGEPCFAEAARRRAAAADVIVVNMHLYGTHVASGGVVLPDHDVVVFDEAHQLEDITSDTTGMALGPGRFVALARTVRQVLTAEELAAAVVSIGTALAAALAGHERERLADPLPPDVADALATARGSVEQILAALRQIDHESDDVKQRKLRAQKAATSLADDLDQAMALPDGYVAWVEGDGDRATMAVAPIDVAPVLRDGVWRHRTAILTSATIPARIVERVGLDPARTTVSDVGSPFDYPSAGLLYCAVHLPDPRSPAYAAAVHDELEALVLAAGGRTLALFTSYRALDAAVAALRPRLPFRVYDQRELPKAALVQAFAAEESACLFATTGLFQGIDVPGATLSLVTIDRIPFPRPDDPLLDARRERAGAAAFSTIDVPRAATLLAQAAGRLIRSAHDRGVVAILDPRLNRARYRWDLVNALPPFRRTRHRADAEAFLREFVSAGTDGR